MTTPLLGVNDDEMKKRSIEKLYWSLGAWSGLIRFSGVFPNDGNSGAIVWFLSYQWFPLGLYGESAA